MTHFKYWRLLPAGVLVQIVRSLGVLSTVLQPSRDTRTALNLFRFVPTEKRLPQVPTRRFDYGRFQKLKQQEYPLDDSFLAETG